MAQDPTTTLAQIGPMNVLAICGGRFGMVGDTLVMPCGSGYSVEVDLDEGSDTYKVRRVFNRGGKKFPKGEQTYVYCDEIGEIAYRASCYHHDYAPFVTS